MIRIGDRDIGDACIFFICGLTQRIGGSGIYIWVHTRVQVEDPACRQCPGLLDPAPSLRWRTRDFALLFKATGRPLNCRHMWISQTCNIFARGWRSGFNSWRLHNSLPLGLGHHNVLNDQAVDRIHTTAELMHP